VYCVRGQARLDKLATQGRPALLTPAIGRQGTLGVAAGRRRGHRTSFAGRRFRDTSRVALEHLWTGDYAALWRAPPTSTHTGDGRAGPAIGWIGKRLTPGYDRRSGRRPRWTTR
jgi:general secretion pathway protein A